MSGPTYFYFAFIISINFYFLDYYTYKRKEKAIYYHHFGVFRALAQLYYFPLAGPRNIITNRVLSRLLLVTFSNAFFY
jgi:hypothetical protein